MTEHEHEPVGYQICVHAVPAPEALLAARLIDITPEAYTADAVLAALTASGLVASDLRAKTIVVLPEDPQAAIILYTAICGFAGRRLDALIGSTMIDPAPLMAAGVSMHSQRPDSVPDLAIVGTSRDDILSIPLDSPLTPRDAEIIRWSRRLRFVPAPSAPTALSQLIVVTAIRARPALERLPYLCEGSEPVGESGSDPVGIDLEALRVESLALRRSSRSGDRDTLVEAIPPSKRDEFLIAAAAVPIQAAMARLGARYNESTNLWHCPRPDRHTHGDATASMRIQKGKVRCYRCDSERIDSLRLAMDCLGYSVDEAASWLLSGASLVENPYIPDIVDDDPAPLAHIS